MRIRIASVAALVVVMVATSAFAEPTRSSHIAVGEGGVVFVVNPDQNTVARLVYDANDVGTLTHEAAVGRYPRTVALAGSYVFTADQTDDTVSRRNQSDLGDLQQVNLGHGCGPYGVAPFPGGGGLVVTCQGTSEVVLLDPALAVVARIKLPWSNARAIAVSSDGAFAYVTHYLTEEPSQDAHVSVVDLGQKSVSRVLAVPPDLVTCETQNSGQGVFNLVSAVALMPDGAPSEVAGQLWLGGTQENTISKGLFKRDASFKDQPGSLLFPWVQYSPFPAGGGGRNVYKASFHDITRFGIFKVDVASGNVVGKIDIDEANNATDIDLSADGRVAYVVDVMFNSYHVFNTTRGQGASPTTLFAAVSSNGPGGANPQNGCVPEPLRSVSSERDFRLAPQAQISVLDPINPVKLVGDTFRPVSTGVEYDAGNFVATGSSRMLAVPDGIGTAPMGVRVDGDRVFVANYLSRNVVVAAAAVAGGPSPNLRCSSPPNQPCGTNNDCTGGVGFCNHPGGAACTTDGECGAAGPCVQTAVCVPLMLGDAVASITDGAGRCTTPADQACASPADCDPDPGFCNTTGAVCVTDGDCGDPGAGARCVIRATCVAIASDAMHAGILDGKILFNTAARDGSFSNGVGLGAPTPLFNAAASSAKVPGAVTSTSHDASYVTCSTCHADFGGQDGRTWDFAQFGASLRNSMDLRGRSGFSPGFCSNDAGVECFFDATCGVGNFCKMQPSMIPPNVPASDRERYFNPMLTVHWNGDRDEVEDFEHTYRSLLGAGDCDGVEFAAGCQGGLIQRSRDTSIDPMDVNDDLGAPNRNIRGAAYDKIVGVRLTHMADFVYSLTDFPKNPNPATEATERGRRIFNDPSTKCADCHNGGPGAGKQFFTDKKPNAGFDPSTPGRSDGNNPFVRHDVGTMNLFDAADPLDVAMRNQTFQNAGNPPDVRTIPGSRGPLGDYITPVLNDLWNTPPYLHDGSAHTLLDVVRPCDSTVDNCNVAGAGRNVDGQHGVTSMLTPQQLNDLAAFQNSLTVGSIVGTNERVLTFGTMDLKSVTLKLPKTNKKGRTKPGSLVVNGSLAGTGDPASGIVLTLAIPNGGQMQMVSRPLEMRGKGKRFTGGVADAGGKLKVVLRRSGDGFKFVVTLKGADVAQLDTGSRDLSVTVEMGGTQFVRNRNLVLKKNVLKLPKKSRR
ncbi:MAG TPA: hypothetical protein VGR62_21570 [Candidatus Binatia bacterium]|nr:hypothetical protein [Candidatus Binatia bacterium]